MENTEILAIYGTEYKEMTKRLLEEAELDSRIPDKECRIGLNPTWFLLQNLPGEPPPIRKSWQGS